MLSRITLQLIASYLDTFSESFVHPEISRDFTGMGHIQLFWVTYSSASPPSYINWLVSWNAHQKTIRMFYSTTQFRDEYLLNWVETQVQIKPTVEKKPSNCFLLLVGHLVILWEGQKGGLIEPTLYLQSF